MKRVGIVPNLLKDQELKMTNQVVRWLLANNFEVFLAQHISDLLETDLHSLITEVEEKQLFTHCEVIIAIGGDGTILNVAQKAYQTLIPIIGINLGRLGFLADIESHDIDRLLKNLLSDDYTIEERMMLEVKLIEPSGDVKYFYALNDMSITRSSFSRLTEFELKINEQFVDFYAADGIIVSTPTGSTAYNLSAGGPIVSPTANVMILTPICPHTIYARSIVVADSDEVKIKTYNHNGTQLELAIDGQTKAYITPGHSVEIKKANYTTKLMKLHTQEFFEILRKKIVERHK